ncbi:MAG: A/G-specific adenine glycosylase [Pseudohongiellaceae bacterium]
MSQFSRQVLHWFDLHGRKDLPWQLNPSAYRVWVSEIMLQQTQVTTVIPYFQRFMTQFPQVNVLAEAPLDQVLHLWTGLGYYARARNLHKAAQQLMQEYAGEFPSTTAQWVKLPGIGISTAGAIVALAFDQPAAILDGNVKRVLTRHFAIAGWPEQRPVNDRLWNIAQEILPVSRFADYTQAMMDLGALVCTRSMPNCPDCPVKKTCRARAQQTIADYPGRKSGRTLPVRQVTMYILQNREGEVLLMKRPPTGIWGGLWSFPESPVDIVDIEGSAGSRWSEEINTGTTLPMVRHSFTHFHLHITPVLTQVGNSIDAVAEPSDRIWYAVHRPARIGLAAPVKKLLEQIANRPPTP